MVMNKAIVKLLSNSCDAIIFPSYIFDPADAYGSDFSGKTFGGLKSDEITKFDEHCN